MPRDFCVGEIVHHLTAGLTWGADARTADYAIFLRNPGVRIHITANVRFPHDTPKVFVITVVRWSTLTAVESSAAAAFLFLPFGCGFNHSMCAGSRRRKHHL